MSVLAFIQCLTLQIKSMAYVFDTMTDDAIPYWLGGLIAYGIVVIYVATSGVRAATYWLSIFGAAGIVALLVGAYGSIAQFAPSVYGALVWRRATRFGAIAGLVTGIAVNYYFQLVAESTTLDMDAGFAGLLANVALYGGVSLATQPVSESLSEEYATA